MEIVLIVALSLGYAAFRQWLWHRRRQMVHVERITAMEKGLPVPPLEAEPPTGWGVQRLLLLFGLIWISVGVFLLVLLSAIMASPTRPDDMVEGVQWVGLGPVLIGLSHLVVYWVGKKQEKPSDRSPGVSIEARQAA